MMDAMNDPKTKAWAATIAFSLAGIISLLFFSHVSPSLFPHSIFYGVLVLNTFFSVRFFAALIAPSARQILVDTILCLLFIALAYSLGNAATFPLIATCLFLIAAVKYKIELGSNPYPHVLKKKIGIDLLGAALCAAALAGVLAGYPFESAWALATIFSIANVYLLMIRPMYRF